MPLRTRRKLDKPISLGVLRPTSPHYPEAVRFTQVCRALNWPRERVVKALLSAFLASPDVQSARAADVPRFHLIIPLPFSEKP